MDTSAITNITITKGLKEGEITTSTYTSTEAHLWPFMLVGIQVVLPIFMPIQSMYLVYVGFIVMVNGIHVFLLYIAEENGIFAFKIKDYIL